MNTLASIADTLENKLAMRRITCADCSISKPIGEYYPQSRATKAVQPYCKACHKQRNKTYNKTRTPSHSKRKASECLLIGSRSVLAFEQCLKAGRNNLAHAS